MRVQPHAEGWSVTRAHNSRGPAVYWSRQFAIDAGREVAERDLAELLVYDDTGQVDLRINYMKGAARRRWNPRRRAEPASSDRHVDQPASAANLVEVVLPYDSWCLRTARSESAKALTGLCAPEVLDGLLLVITELVLYSTVQSRSECTLSVHRMDDEVLIVVRGLHARPTTQRHDGGAIGSGMGAMHSMTTDYGVGQRCVWARFNLLGGSPNSPPSAIGS